MSTTARRTRADATPTTLVGKGVSGIIGGLAGGLVFGIMMQAMGLMPMIAAMIGAESIIVGWLIHLAISMFIGVTYAVLLAPASSMVMAVVTGLGWGLLWWVLGPLLLMPTALGMGVFMINQTTLMSLVGHLIFGAILGIVATMWLHRTQKEGRAQA